MDREMDVSVCVFTSIRLFVCLSGRPSIRTSVNPSPPVRSYIYLHLSVRSSVRSSVPPSVHPSVRSSVRPSIRPSVRRRPSTHANSLLIHIRLSVYRSNGLPFFLSVCRSVHKSHPLYPCVHNTASRYCVLPASVTQSICMRRLGNGFTRWRTCPASHTTSLRIRAPVFSRRIRLRQIRC